jgi:hypothetical protein
MTKQKDLLLDLFKTTQIEEVKTSRIMGGAAPKSDSEIGCCDKTWDPDTYVDCGEACDIDPTNEDCCV